ncbi:MFS transporter [Virgibacillus halodenitrificans]|uniref:MFS transporter n=1 Tax=Virgibacillus halodenitrificans TaxID=1482 RepID=UPI00031C954F|nr:MFS transporter [Virgibacillus halodenitrificans]
MEVKLSGSDDKSINRGFYYICLGAFFIMLSLATHLPAYPHMLAEFQLGAGYAVWMQLGLALGLTGFQPLLGWLGDSLGLKIVILIGATFMIVGSLLVSFSPEFWILVIGLFCKGIAGAAVAPAGVAYAGKFMIGDQRGKALGTFMAFSTIGALFGPIISGFFVDAMGWKSSFVLTACLGAIAFLLFLRVPALAVSQRKKLDIGGVILVLIVLTGLLTVPTFINAYGFMSSAWLPSFIIFILGLCLLIIVEKKQHAPLLDINYVGKQSFWVPTLIAVLLFIGFSGVMYLLTFFVQNVQGKPATTVGLLQMAIFLGSSLAAFISGRVIKKYPARLMLGSGITLFAIGIIMLTMVNIETSFSYLFISMSLIGIGSGFNTPVVKAIIVSQADSTRMNVVTFTNNVIENIAQRLGASFALVTFAIFAANGNKVSALANMSWIFIGLIIIAAIFIPLIPNKIQGIHHQEKSIVKNGQQETESAG